MKNSLSFLAKMLFTKTRKGLGIRNIQLMNETLLMELGWGILNNQNDLWVKVVIHKYGCYSSNSLSILKGQNAFNVWQGICKAWLKLVSNISFRL